jgi:peptidoglycan L-alanyl-D-glutamate endopeptidase CwlK
MTRNWDKVSVERLKGVHPDLRRLADAVLQAAPWPIRVTEGLRTLERQKHLVAIKASKTMNSRHLTGHAIDVVPYIDLDRDGKIETEELYNKELFRQLIPIAKEQADKLKIEVTWGYDWGWDMPHWELNRRYYPA